MYIYGCKLSGAQPSQAKSLADDLKTHITENGSSEVEVRVEEERRNLGRTLVIIAENHSAETRSADLARRLMKNDVYRFIASEYFYNAGSLRTEIRDFMRGSRTSLGSLLCPYENLLRDLRLKSRYVLFVGSRAETRDIRDRRIARHFVEEVADRKLNRTTPGVLVCGINHGSRVAQEGQQKTMRRWLEDAGFKILGARLATDDIDRATLRIHQVELRTDTVWPVGETQTESNAIRLLDLVTTTSEYTVVPTKSSPFERVTDDWSGDFSSLSMAERYELVILAKSMQRPCKRWSRTLLRNTNAWNFECWMLRTGNQKALSSLCPHSRPAGNPSIVVWVLKARPFRHRFGNCISYRAMSAGRMKPPLSQIHGACSVRTSRVRKGH